MNPPARPATRLDGKNVHLTVYLDDGRPTGEWVVIPLPLLRRAIHRIQTLDMDMTIEGTDHSKAATCDCTGDALGRHNHRCPART
jgi:hypothetical protein